MNKFCFLLIILFSSIIFSRLFISVQEGMVNSNIHLARCTGNSNQHTNLFCNHAPKWSWKGKFNNCINNKCDNCGKTFLKYKNHFIDEYSPIDNVFDNLRMSYNSTC